MPTTITEIEDIERGKFILHIEGSMTAEDAALLEKIALDLREQNNRNFTLDLADLDFLDSESAPILKRMERVHGFEIEGIEFFLQNIINEVENRSTN
ncbi:MAG TPA: STAS domain-containing protein [Pyrinomonadaceae bacterium]|jgi:anti-anti-sigma regulatory factor